ncbi:MAG: Smr/MutS family protein [Paramuribaculum sp.]|nr:Smr/MutS family protein [Paramuribaculum sp.]
MIYPSNIEYKLGFDFIRRELVGACSTPLGEKWVKSMAFSDDFDRICAWVDETAEMLAALRAGYRLPWQGVRDVRPILAQLAVEGRWLTADECAALRSTLRTQRAVVSFFTTNEGLSFERLSKVVESIADFSIQIRFIDEVIDDLGNVKDSASPELAGIRRKLHSLSSRAGSVMRGVMERAIREGYIDSDVTPSMRDGRLVLPVAPMYKRKLNGIVHDESATGKTLFIEPAEVVELNNNIRELEIEEQREIVRILTRLADKLRPDVPAMSESADVLAYVDFVNAKAEIARRFDADRPHIAPEPVIELYHACHPALMDSLQRQGKQQVALDVVLDKGNRILVISGPNAGGKSVCLKTVGVNQYMLQCGMLPVVYSNSHMGIFRDIFVDLGDDQSMDNDLSTYSSHIGNMKQILRHGGNRSMILIDEFGSGTEPHIGGAIAQAVLQSINAKEMMGIITTHYHNLKLYADEADGLVNGSMTYDRQRMAPTFGLAIGQAGSSFALDIARSMGLPAEVVQRARELAGEDYINLDKYLQAVARDKRYWESKRLSIRQKEKKLEETLQRYDAEADQLHARRNEIISEAKEDARKILEGSNAAIERTIHEIRRSQADRLATQEARKKLQAEKESLIGESRHDDKLIDKLTRRRPKKKQKPTVAPSAPVEIKPDDHVRLDGEGTVGTVISVEGKSAVVMFGQLKTTVKLDRLKQTQASPDTKRSTPKVSTAASDGSRERQLAFSRQLDVRGMRVDEALQAVMYYIDDAVQFGATPVRILHGTGTGALRQSIRQYLSTLPVVKAYHDEHVQFGGAGITVIEL